MWRQRGNDAQEWRQLVPVLQTLEDYLRVLSGAIIFRTYGLWAGNFVNGGFGRMAPQPRWGWRSYGHVSQGSLANSATLGFGAQSLWD